MRYRRAAPDERDGGEISRPGCCATSRPRRSRRSGSRSRPRRQVDVSGGPSSMSGATRSPCRRGTGPRWSRRSGLRGTRRAGRAAWVSFPGGEPGLSVDVRHEPVAELHDAPELVCELLAVLPRLRGWRAVAAGVGAERAGPATSCTGPWGSVGEPPIKWLQNEKPHRPRERPPRRVPAIPPSEISASPPQCIG